MNWVFLNNQMDDFSAKGVQSLRSYRIKTNSIAPEKKNAKLYDSALIEKR
jgi:gamma-glutamyltranspeptidase